MSKINNKSEQNKEPSLSGSRKTVDEINNLKIDQIKEDNDEDKKEDSSLKKNNFENPRYISNTSEVRDSYPFKKYPSGLTDNKNKDFIINDDEDDEWENPLAGKGLVQSQKKVRPKNILNVIKKMNNNSEKLSITQPKNESNSIKNEDCFYSPDGNNNYNYNYYSPSIQSSDVKNAINRIIPKLNQQNTIEELQKNLFVRKNTNIKRCCLQNYGNTSYLNTILQCLSNIEILKNFFLNENVGGHILSNIKLFPLSFVTQRLFNHFYIKRDLQYNLESYLRVLGSLNVIYSSTKQRNFKDCLTFILDNLQDELNKIKNINQKNNFDKTKREEVIDYGIMNYKNKYDCIISDIFNWHELKEFHCNGCGNGSYDFGTYNTIQLDCLHFKNTIYRNNITIFDSLKFEYQNKNINRLCNFCKKKASINMISIIYKSPKIFVFLLNNGDFDEQLLNLNFKLEPQINLSKFIESKNSPKKYELVGIISLDIRNKKYVNYCKSFEDNNWYFYYDEDIAQNTEEQVIMDNFGKYVPSALFYKSVEL